MYNKAYADGVAGHKHPGLMGTGFRGKPRSFQTVSVGVVEMRAPKALRCPGGKFYCLFTYEILSQVRKSSQKSNC
jgi:hypothetical protein